MQPKSLKNYYVIFILAVVIQIMAVTTNFYINCLVETSLKSLQTVISIEREFLETISMENIFSNKAENYDRVILQYNHISNMITEEMADLNKGLFDIRKQLIGELFVLQKEKQQLHTEIQTIIPHLTNSIQYIHEHHIAYLKNLLARGRETQDYDIGKNFQKSPVQSASETDIIKAAISIQSSMLKIFKTFSKLQSNFFPDRIKTEFNEKVKNFYMAVNIFEDFSLDAQDGILVEELLINGRTFENSFNRLIAIENRIIKLTKNIEENRKTFISNLQHSNNRFEHEHQLLAGRARYLDYLSFIVCSMMMVLILWYGRLIIKGFQETVTETERIQKNIEYRIVPQKTVFLEFRIIYNALNSMAETIKEQMIRLENSKSLLEKRVSLRTAELSALNRKLRKEIKDRIKNETERRALQNRLHQAQKMESIGTLAGGIAHDFNNILSGIFGFSQLAKIHLNSPEKAANDINQLLKSANRATDLVRQILTFSRQTEHKKRLLSIFIVVKEVLKLMRSTLPSTIEIKENITSKATIMADPTQIHQVIMNLCTNAFHAMKNTGGILTVGLSEVQINKPLTLLNPAMPSGKYIILEVSDTGEGINESTINKIFDPYFTTKKIGEGTGLGLAMVHAIIEDHNGHIEVCTTEGQGSSFYVYFPIVEKETKQLIAQKPTLSISGGHESIMIVDDETAILTATKNILENYGYNITTFSDGQQAYEAFKKNPEQFDLIITDMTMPKMTGDIFAAKVLDMIPDLPIFLCTGYSERISETKAFEAGIRKFIQKPVNYNDLVTLIRQVLDKESGPREQ